MIIRDGKLVEVTNEDLDCSAYTVKDGVRIIGKGAFSGCKIQYVSLPQSVEVIEEEAFMDCIDLISVKGGENVKEVGARAFLNCYHLNSISMYLSDKIKVIEDGTFCNCFNLNKFVFPTYLEKIGKEAFYDSNIEKVCLHNCITEIGERAFNGCWNLKEIFIADYDTNEKDLDRPSLIIEKSAFADCKRLLTVSLPNYLKEIKDGVFSNCKMLHSLYIPDSVTKIGAFAFSDCSSLKFIHISNNVKEVGAFAFIGDNNLEYDKSIPAFAKFPKKIFQDIIEKKYIEGKVPFKRDDGFSISFQYNPFLIFNGYDKTQSGIIDSDFIIVAIEPVGVEFNGFP